MSRKMVKWAPFVSLKEQTIYLNKLREERLKVERPILSEDDMMVINDILVHYHGQVLKITYYKRGMIEQIETSIRKIDTQNKKIVTSDISIAFDDLIKLEE